MPRRPYRYGTGYRRGYRSSYDSSEAARRHVREAEEFSREIGGTDADLKAYFFSLPQSELNALLMEYGQRYGRVAEEYARETFSTWKSGGRRMSGLVAKRLFSLLPKRMPLSLKYELAGNVWQHFGPSSSHAFVVGVDTPVDEIAATVAQTLESTVTSYSKNVSESSSTEPKWWLPTSEFTALYGRNRSFNGKFHQECLNAHWFLSLDDARAKMGGMA